jgi:CspA family cold shock protein
VVSAERGCGFIVPDGGGTAMFVDFREIVGAAHRTLIENTKVRFDPADGEYGPEATNVTFSSA